jgi:hypothetical protein
MLSSRQGARGTTSGARDNVLYFRDGDESNSQNNRRRASARRDAHGDQRPIRTLHAQVTPPSAPAEASSSRTRGAGDPRSLPRSITRQTLTHGKALAQAIDHGEKRGGIGGAARRLLRARRSAVLIHARVMDDTGHQLVEVRSVALAFASRLRGAAPALEGERRGVWRRAASRTAVLRAATI